MIKDEAKLRHGAKGYHDLIFEEEIKDLINITTTHYEAYRHPKLPLTVPHMFLEPTIKMRSSMGFSNCNQRVIGTVK